MLWRALSCSSYINSWAGLGEEVFVWLLLNAQAPAQHCDTGLLSNG